jgi:drug/metabolite transporter (DMT)-like permease
LSFPPNIFLNYRSITIVSDSFQSKKRKTMASLVKTKPAVQSIAIALALVYIVWGTTYLVLKWGAAAMPPFLLNGTRFVVAGLLMIGLARLKGGVWPSAKVARNAGFVGFMMVSCAMSLITIAHKLGIGSALMATIVTTMPMWLALWTRIGGESVPLTSWIGLTIGVGGAALLAMEGDVSVTPIGAICAFAGPFCWSIGSYASRKLEQPIGIMGAGFQWLIGGSIALTAGLLLERPQDMLDAGAGAWAAWAYLVVFGTLIALNAYLWLLQHVSPALAGSYSFVNPAVALVVGVWLGAEQFTGWIYLAFPMVLVALLLILYGPILSARKP